METSTRSPGELSSNFKLKKYNGMSIYPEWPDELFGVPLDRSMPVDCAVKKLPPPPQLPQVIQNKYNHRRLLQPQPRLNAQELTTLVEPRSCSFQIACKNAKATRMCYHCKKFDFHRKGLYCDACFEARHPPFRIEHKWTLLNDDELDEEKQWLAHLARHKMAQDYQELQLLLENTTMFLQSTEQFDIDSTTDKLDTAVESMKTIDTSIRGLMVNVEKQLKVRNLPQAVAVQRIQDMWKVRKARKRLTQMIRSIYTEMVDPTTGKIYYVNKRTMQAQWGKPKGYDTVSYKKKKKVSSREEAALFIQRAFRSHIARRSIRKLLRSIYQKILDPASGKYYYLNKHTKTTSWTKPKLLGSEEFEPKSPKKKKVTTPDTAARMIQRMYRCGTARKQLRRLLSRVYQKIWEPTVSRFYYYNIKTKQVSWSKPRFVDDSELLSPRSFAIAMAEEEAFSRKQRLDRIKSFTLSEAASYVQRRIRIHQAHNKLRAMAKEAYQAILDPTTNAYFYHNVRTGLVSWSKPRCLGGS